MIRRCGMLIVPVVLLMASLVGAQATSSNTPFRYERPLTPTDSGPQRVVVDVPLLSGAASPTLDDLRFFTASGVEVPYVIVPPSTSPAKWRKVKFSPAAPHGDYSGLVLHVGLGASEMVDCVKFSGFPAPFTKSVEISDNDSGDGADSSVAMVDGDTIFDLPKDHMAKTTLCFEPRYEEGLKLMENILVEFLDSSSPRLPLPKEVHVRVASNQVETPPARVPLEFTRRTAEPGTSRFRVKLPGGNLPLTAIEVGVGEPTLLRKARVIEARLSGSQIAPTVLGEAELRKTQEGKLTAEFLAIPIVHPQGTDLDLVVADGNNPPLQLNGVTAVLSPLSQIYLENSAKAPLVARFGSPKLTNPHYDLEARRGSLHPGKLPQAEWGERKDLQPSVSTVVAGKMPELGAPLGAVQCRYERAIPATVPGLTALWLDAAVLAHSPTLGDLRILNAENRQVPYILEHRDEPMVLDLPAPEKLESKSGGFARYAIPLPYTTLPAAELVLNTTAGGVFSRTVEVLGERAVVDPRDAREVTLATGHWDHAETDTSVSPLSIKLSNMDNIKSLILSINDGDNAPLAITSAQLRLPSYRLRYFAVADMNVRLCYGIPRLGAPKYDISLLAPVLLWANAQEVSLAPETRVSVAISSTQKYIFWALLGCSVLALVAIAIRLVRKV